MSFLDELERAIEAIRAKDDSAHPKDYAEEMRLAIYALRSHGPRLLAAVRLAEATIAQDDAKEAFSKVDGCLNDEMVAFGASIKGRKAAVTAYRAACASETGTLDRDGGG